MNKQQVREHIEALEAKVERLEALSMTKPIPKESIPADDPPDTPENRKIIEEIARDTCCGLNCQECPFNHKLCGMTPNSAKYAGKWIERHKPAPPLWLPRGLCWVSDYNPEPGIGCDIAVIVDTCEGLHFPLGGKRAGNPWAYAAPLNDTEICRYHGGMYLAKDGKVVGDIGF